ncbi:MAG: nitroreductase family protein [Erysipelotrichaceae bacterium]|nr:nitroreductase family protein [Erysipelotrichaceae bacterium]
MDFLELAKKRCSVREFKTDKVSDEIIDKIIKAGCIAPTACNNQPFKILVIKTKEALDKIKKCTECHFNAPIVFVVCYDKNLCWKRPFDQKTSGDIDASIVATHMILEACDLGVGSTWVMFFKADILKQEFELPDYLEPVALLPMGYPVEGYMPSATHTKYREFEELVDIK